MSVEVMKLGLLQEADNDSAGEAVMKTQQMLTYYELDLGLNHVVRKYSEQLEEHANFLISGQCPNQQIELAVLDYFLFRLTL